MRNGEFGWKTDFKIAERANSEGREGVEERYVMLTSPFVCVGDKMFYRGAHPDLASKILHPLR